MLKRSLFVAVLLFIIIETMLAYPFEVTQATPLGDTVAPPPGSCVPVNDIPQIECEALVALYNSTDGDNWNNNTGWLLSYMACSWHGVTCDGGHVRTLNLPSNGLNGTIPPELGNLSNLNYFFLDNNQLTNVPPELGDLPSLAWLDLDYNQLTSVPPELGNLSSLTQLYLGYNQLTSVPPELGSLSNLSTLELDGNQLTSVPPELGDLSSLTQLYLDYNQLTSVPPELGNLSNLTRLYLFNNQLTSVPPELGNLSNLTHLYLYSNPIKGPLQVDFINLTNLNTFRFDQTNLCVPAEVAFQTWLDGIVDVNSSDITCLADVTIIGPTAGVVENPYAFTADTSPISATTPFTYTWVPVPDAGQNTASATYSWMGTGLQSITVTVENVSGSVSDSHVVALQPEPCQIEDFAITPAYPQNIDSLTLSFICTDGDVSISWTRNGQILPTYNDVMSIPNTATRRDDEWCAKVIPYNIEGVGQAVETCVEIHSGNIRPEANDVTITPKAPTDSNTLVLTYDYFDQNNDS